jgi:ribosomal-protein-alanine N-acetyltransferase
MSTPVVHLRAMQMDDIEQVAALDRLSFSLPWSANSYRFELLENQASRLWVAELLDDDQPVKIVAMIVIWQIVDEAHIATLAVHPEYRRLGLGRRLLAFALMEAARGGLTTATLEVRAGNLAAQALYRQFGFFIAGVRPRYYLDNHEDALIMDVKLDGLADWIYNTEDTLILPKENENEAR